MAQRPQDILAKLYRPPAAGTRQVFALSRADAERLSGAQAVRPCPRLAYAIGIGGASESNWMATSKLCLLGAVQLPMHQRSKGQYVKRILLGHRPFHLWVMCERIPHRTE